MFLFGSRSVHPLQRIRRLFKKVRQSIGLAFGLGFAAGNLSPDSGAGAEAGD